MSNTGPFDLSKTPIHLGNAAGGKGAAVPLEGFAFDGPSFGAYIDQHCSPEEPHRMVFIEATPGNWGAWECHTDADEVVIVLEGQGEFIHEVDGVERRMPFQPGSTVINPKGVWHTADVTQPMRAVYITPIPGTEHRPR